MTRPRPFQHPPSSPAKLETLPSDGKATRCFHDSESVGRSWWIRISLDYVFDSSKIGAVEESADITEPGIILLYGRYDRSGIRGFNP